MARGYGKRVTKEADESTIDKSTEERAKLIRSYADKFPKSVEQHILRFAPQLAKFSMVLQFKIMPFVYVLYESFLELIEKLKPYYVKYHFEDLVPAVAGFTLCFFGGHFPLTVVAAECVITTAYVPVSEAFHEIKDQYAKAKIEFQKDSAEDKDGNGIPDVQEITDAEYVTRKGLLLAKALDPVKCDKAIKALNSAIVLILSAIYVTFVRALALGKAIGDTGRTFADRHITPKATEMAPIEYRKWVPYAIHYMCTTLAMSFAFMLQRCISAIHSALRGGMLFTRTVFAYLDKHKIMKIDHEQSSLDEIIGISLAVVGFLFQWQCGFALFFPLNLVLFPFSLVEVLLQTAVSFATPTISSTV